ncbi:SIDT2 [Symbiodinium natans]|uniref:SIDT2 protein n=1 Tax=Symbiodinium natans TaxID=878477 RepID=A0A812QTV8_9DINO|nr:SIDT2 [Symbiodinium natans]
MMTISRGSLPALQEGRWLLFVVCNLRYLRTTSNPSCPEARLDVEFHAEHQQLQKLWTGAAIMVLGPALALFCVNAMYWLLGRLTYTFLNHVSSAPQTRHRLWPVFMPLPSCEHLDMVREKLQLIYQPIPFFPALLALMIGVFLATAAQFVITHYGLMTRTGNRDICFYNEKCYHPGLAWDIPWNHILSNLAYFVAGVHTMLQTFFAESRCRLFMRRTMEALFRSVHLDPYGGITRPEWAKIFDDADVNKDGVVSRQEWQEQHRDVVAFDFITDAGHLSREDWLAAFKRLDANGDGVLTKAKFRLASRSIDVRTFYAIGTTFIAEGVGSMCYHLCPSVETFQFDTCFMISIAHLLTMALADWSQPNCDSTAALKYFVYILTPMWLINFIGTWYDIEVFNSTWIYWTYTSLVVMRVLQSLVVFVVLLVYVDPSARESLGGTANTFLLLSIAVMVVVVSRQIYMHDLRFMVCSVAGIGSRILKYSYLAVMVVVGMISLQCFDEKVVIVAPEATPAQSHDANQDCVFSIFDLHDCWHLLSAVALALFSMFILDIRVNSWARNSGIQVIAEQPADHYSRVLSELDAEASSEDFVDTVPEPIECSVFLLGSALGLRDDVGRLTMDVSREANGYVIDSEPCNPPSGSNYCQASVQSALAGLQGLQDPGARIGAVLAVQDQSSEACCMQGTDYDEFVFENAPKHDLRNTSTPLFDSSTALVIIDVQKDFTVGSFAQPCWGQGGETFLRKTTQLIRAAADAGATVIASKDIHPSNHCSFAGEDRCRNQKDTTEGTATARYVNEFPSHCSFDMKDGHVVPQKAPETPFCRFLESIEVKVPLCALSDFVGADFDPTLAEALSLVDRSQVEVVFKGFHANYDSFSAMEHRETKEGAMRVQDEESAATGGFALPAARDDACHGRWDQVECYPTKAELDDPSAGRRSFASILTARNIRKMVVIGLVYDFCVKETAIFTKENSPSTQVRVLADLTRPSFDGKPGAPYTSGLCDGQESANGFCAEGGGTKPMYQRVLQDFLANGVEVKRLVEPTCA